MSSSELIRLMGGYMVALALRMISVLPSNRTLLLIRAYYCWALSPVGGRAFSVFRSEAHKPFLRYPRSGELQKYRGYVAKEVDIVANRRYAIGHTETRSSLSVERPKHE
eukprot:scaffold496_cov108-Skeletonema_dohrnii-CCMP3373.AAC.1